MISFITPNCVREGFVSSIPDTLVTSGITGTPKSDKRLKSVLKTIKVAATVSCNRLPHIIPKHKRATQEKPQKVSAA